jgi:hypothetical protein
LRKGLESDMGLVYSVELAGCPLLKPADPRRGSGCIRVREVGGKSCGGKGWRGEGQDGVPAARS